MSRTMERQLDVISLSLDSSDGSPVYRQLITQIERGVLSGRLKPGAKLPTIRSLAVALKINPNTIAKAYGELEIRGLLVTQTGNGTFISDKKPPGADEAREEKIREIIGRFLREMAELGVTQEEIYSKIENVENDLAATAWQTGVHTPS